MANGNFNFDVNISFRDANNTLKRVMQDASTQLNSLNRITEMAKNKVKFIDDKFEPGKAGSTAKLGYQQAINEARNEAAKLGKFRTAQTQQVFKALDALIEGKNSRDPAILEQKVKEAQNLISSEVKDLGRTRQQLSKAQTKIKKDLLEMSKSNGQAGRGVTIAAERLIDTLGDGTSANLADALKQLSTGKLGGVLDSSKLGDDLSQALSAQLAGLTRQLSAGQEAALRQALATSQFDFNKATHGFDNAELLQLAQEVQKVQKTRMDASLKELQEMSSGLSKFAKTLDMRNPEMQQLAAEIKNIGNHAAFKSGQGLNKLYPFLEAGLKKIGLTGKSLENIFDHLHKSINGTGDLAVQVMQAQSILGSASKRVKHLVEQGTANGLSGDDLARYVETNMMTFDPYEEASRKHVRDSIRNGADKAQLEEFRNTASTFGLNPDDHDVLAAIGETGLMKTVNNFRGLMVNTFANLFAGIGSEVVMNLAMQVGQVYTEVGQLERAIHTIGTPTEMLEVRKAAIDAAVGFENGLQTVTGFVQQLKEMGTSGPMAVQILEKLASAARTSAVDLSKTTQGYLTMVDATGPVGEDDAARATGVFAQNDVNQTKAAQVYAQLAQNINAASLSYEEITLLSAYYTKQNREVADSVQGVIRDLREARVAMDNTEAPFKAANKNVDTLMNQWLNLIAGMKNGQFDYLFAGMASVAEGFIQTLTIINDALKMINDLTGGWGNKLMVIAGAVGTLSAIAMGISYANSMAQEFRGTLITINQLLRDQARNAQMGAAGVTGAMAAQTAAANAAGVGGAVGGAAAAAAAKKSGAVAGASLIGGITNTLKQGAWKLATSLGSLFLRAIPIVNWVLLGASVISMIWNAVNSKNKAAKEEAEKQARMAAGAVEAAEKRREAYNKGMNTMEEVLGGNFSAQNLASYLGGNLDDRIKILGLNVDNVRQDFQGMVNAAKLLNPELAKTVEWAGKIAAQTSAAKDAFKLFEQKRQNNINLKLDGGSALFNAMFDQASSEDAYLDTLKAIKGTIVDHIKVTDAGNKVTDVVRQNTYAIHQDTAKMAGNKTIAPTDGVTTGTRAGKDPPPKTNQEADVQIAKNMTANATYFDKLLGTIAFRESLTPELVGKDKDRVLRATETQTATEFAKLKPDQVVAAFDKQVKMAQANNKQLQADIKKLQSNPNRKPTALEQQSIDNRLKGIESNKADIQFWTAQLNNYKAILNATNDARADLVRRTTQERFDSTKAIRSIGEYGPKNADSWLGKTLSDPKGMPWQRYWEVAARAGFQPGEEAWKQVKKSAPDNIKQAGGESNLAKMYTVFGGPKSQMAIFQAVMKEATAAAQKLGRGIISDSEAFTRAMLWWKTGDFGLKKYKNLEALQSAAALKGPDADVLKTARQQVDIGYGARGIEQNKPKPNDKPNTKAPAGTGTSTTSTSQNFGKQELLAAMGIAGIRLNYGFKDPKYAKSVYGEHYGEDYGAKDGTPLNMPFMGKAIARFSEGLGLYVDMMDKAGNVLRAGHLKDVTEALKKTLQSKQWIDFTQGDLFGWSGGVKGRRNSGKNTSGAHLHLSTFKAGSQTRFRDESNPDSISWQGIGAPSINAQNPGSYITPAMTQNAPAINNLFYDMNKQLMADGLKTFDAQFAQDTKKRQVAMEAAMQQELTANTNYYIKQIKLRPAEFEKLQKEKQGKEKEIQSKYALQLAQKELAAIEAYYASRVSRVATFFKNSKMLDKFAGGKFKGQEDAMAKLFNSDVLLDGVMPARNNVKKALSDQAQAEFDKLQKKKDDFQKQLAKLLNTGQDQLRVKKSDPMTAALENFQDELKTGLDTGQLEMDDKDVQFLIELSERLKRVTGDVAAFQKSFNKGLDSRNMLEPADRVLDKMDYMKRAMKDQQMAYKQAESDYKKAADKSPEQYVARARMSAARLNQDMIRTAQQENQLEVERMLREQVISAGKAGKQMLSEYRQLKAEINGGDNEFVRMWTGYKNSLQEINRTLQESTKLSNTFGKTGATAASTLTAAMQGYNQHLRIQLDLVNRIAQASREERSAAQNLIQLKNQRSVDGGDANRVKAMAQSILQDPQMQAVLKGLDEGEQLRSTLKNLSNTGTARNSQEMLLYNKLPSILNSLEKLYGKDSPYGDLSEFIKLLDKNSTDGKFKMTDAKGQPLTKEALLSTLKGVQTKLLTEKPSTSQTPLEKDFLSMMEENGNELVSILMQGSKDLKDDSVTLLRAVRAIADYQMGQMLLDALPVNSAAMTAATETKRAGVQADRASAMSGKLEGEFQRVAEGTQTGNLLEAYQLYSAAFNDSVNADVNKIKAQIAELKTQVTPTDDRAIDLAGLQTQLGEAEARLAQVPLKLDEALAGAIDTRIGQLSDKLGDIEFTSDGLDSGKITELPGLTQKLQGITSTIGELANLAASIKNDKVRDGIRKKIEDMTKQVSAKTGGNISSVVDAVTAQAQEDLDAALVLVETQDPSKRISAEEFTKRVEGILTTVNGLNAIIMSLPETSQTRQDNLEKTGKFTAAAGGVLGTKLAELGVKVADQKVADAGENLQKRYTATGELLTALQKQEASLVATIGKTTETEELGRLNAQLETTRDRLRDIKTEYKKLGEEVDFDTMLTGVSVADTLTIALVKAKQAFLELQATGKKSTLEIQESLMGLFNTQRQLEEEKDMPMIGTSQAQSAAALERRMARAKQDLADFQQMRALAQSGDQAGLDAAFMQKFGMEAGQVGLQMLKAADASGVLKKNIEQIEIEQLRVEVEKLNRIFEQFTGNIRQGLRDVLSIPRKIKQENDRVAQELKQKGMDMGVNVLNQNQVETEIKRLKEQREAALTAGEYDQATAGIMKYEEQLVSLRMQYEAVRVAMDQSKEDAKSWSDMLLESFQGVIDRFGEMVEGMTANSLMTAIFGKSADDGSGSPLDIFKALNGAATQPENGPSLLAGTLTNPLWVKVVGSSPMGDQTNPLINGLTQLFNPNPTSDKNVEGINQGIATLAQPDFGVKYTSEGLSQFGALTEDTMLNIGNTLNDTLIQNGNKQSASSAGGGILGSLFGAGAAFDPMTMIAQIGLQVGMSLLSGFISDILNSGDKSKGLYVDPKKATAGTSNPNVRVTVNTTSQQQIRQESDKAVGRGLRKVRQF